ncbi:hypothetical protein TWF730_010326 [Orbilia blumenaviensis]|uniref:Uncharacterized protein n=1 Tax=Orbilia blumenaviensis TaxID=1796055 RepID=A0AAV9UNC7_9PEZI
MNKKSNMPKENWRSLSRERRRGEGRKLLNFREVIGRQEDFDLRRPESRASGWRYMLDYPLLFTAGLITPTELHHVRNHESVPRILWDSNQPSGAISNILDCIPVGEEVEIRGRTGEIIYEGRERFRIESKERRFTRVSLVLCSTGVTLGFALITRTLLTDGDSTQLKTEDDILLRDELDSERLKGFLRVLVDADMIKENLFALADDSVLPMIQKAALPALRDWGCVEDRNMFGF